MRSLGCFSAIALALWLFCGESGAQPGSSRFEYRLGGQFFSSFTSEIRLDSVNRGVGTELRLESDANLEERIEVGRADGFYNFNPRHYIWLAYYDVDRTGTRNLSRDIRFGDETFTIATTVRTTFDQQVAKLAYGFNALVRPRATLGPSFGLHVMELRASLGVLDRSRAEEAATTAPLPVIGVLGSYELSDRWSLHGAVQWFDIDIGDVDGLFTDFVVTVEHDTFDRFGFGFGINNNSLDIESGDDDFRGTIDLSFRSALIYFRGSLGSVSNR